ncbi:MAG: hypothetical protein LBF86_00985 [Helicobacteraceae bacterium]|jgi:hypothetical protein|nr:hypothetical protein [Helicobacteraceae bacterium]
MREKILFVVALTLFYLTRQRLQILCSIIKRCYLIKRERRKEIVDRLKIKRSHLLVSDRLLKFFNATIDKNSQKYLLCCPKGGLNDMLCIINRCINYALDNNRTIYIDGSAEGFLDDLGRYFAAAAQREKIKFDRIDSSLEVFDSYPKYLKKLIDRWLNRSAISFDLNKSYEDRVLMYFGDIIGNEAIGAFSFFGLAPKVRSHIKEIVEQLGEYDAVHIRHSDYKTDYKPFLESVAQNSSCEKIALCTDSYEVQRYAKERFGDRIVCINAVPDTGGKTLHNNPDLDRYQTNLAALTDLFALGAAKKIYTTLVTHFDGRRQITENRSSGFGRLAKELNKRPELIKRLLNDED